MGNSPVETYESKMRDLIAEYKDLSPDDRKHRFTQYVQRETDIFISVIDEEQIGNITSEVYNNLLSKRTQYIKELFDSKDFCLIF